MNWELWTMRIIVVISAVIFLGEVHSWYLRKRTPGRIVTACGLLLLCFWTTGIYMSVDVTVVDSLTVVDWIALLVYCAIAISLIHVNSVNNVR